jgi:hypothetical protein
MIAASYLERPARIGKLALFDVLDPGSIDAQGYLVLRLAGHAASVTANAGLIIDQKAIIHDFTSVSNGFGFIQVHGSRGG